MFIVESLTGKIVDEGTALSEDYPAAAFEVVTQPLPTGAAVLLLPLWDSVAGAWTEGTSAAQVLLYKAASAATKVQAAVDNYDFDKPSGEPSVARAKRTDEINASFVEAFGMAIAGYPHEEVETWIYQADEANDIVDNKGRATPILDAIVAQTGENIDILAAAILAKEAQYKAAIGALVGKRHALINQLNAVDLTLPTAEADIAAIQWV